MSVELARDSQPSQAATDGRVVMNPRFAQRLRQVGINNVNDFLELPGEVVSGHRDRHVVATRIGGIRCFLKKEHRVSWTTRLNNWRQGYGWSSLSEREAQTLEQLRRAGVPVPEWIARGSVADGRSFLLLRGVSRAITLAQALDPGSFTSFERWQLARHIGMAIARTHLAGFDAPDLSMKHVLVRTQDRSVVLLDWPRARRLKKLDRHQCLQALARLHASTPLHLTTTRERLLVVQSFLQTLGFSCPAAPFAREISTIAQSMHHRRSIAEQPIARVIGSQCLRWLNGEQLCVTRPLWRVWNGAIPEWLHAASEKNSSQRRVEVVNLGQLGQGWLIQLPPAYWWRRWWSRLRRQPPQSQAVIQTGLAFRMRRMGLPVAAILAFGARKDGSGFLVVRSPSSFRGLREWLALPRPGRHRVIVRLGRLLKRVHDAGGCQLTSSALGIVEKAGTPRLRILPDGQWARCKRLSHRGQVRDVCRTAQELRLFDRRDLERLMCGYTHGSDLPPRHLRSTSPMLQPNHGGR